MTIDPTRSSDIHARSAPDAAEVTRQPRPSESGEQPKRDHVEISDEARALSEQGHAERIPVTEARIAEIRGRLDADFYTRPEVVRTVAERLLESGDL